MKQLKPMIIACSGDDISTPQMKIELKDAGFDDAITAPMTASYVKEELTNMLDMIVQNLTEYFNVYKMAQLLNSESHHSSDSILDRRRKSVISKPGEVDLLSKVQKLLS